MLWTGPLKHGVSISAVVRVDHIAQKASALLKTNLHRKDVELYQVLAHWSFRRLPIFRKGLLRARQHPAGSGGNRQYLGPLTGAQGPSHRMRGDLLVRNWKHSQGRKSRVSGTHEFLKTFLGDHSWRVIAKRKFQTVLNHF
eukprot:s5508_g3.t1